MKELVFSADGGLGTNLSICFKLRKYMAILFVCPHVLVCKRFACWESLTERAAVDIKGII